jgi:superfamily II DNA or RNA helicase
MVTWQPYEQAVIFNHEPKKLEYRPYQLTAIDNIFEQWKRVDGTIAIMPTGAGKTVLAWGVIDRIMQDEPDARCLFYAHLSDLVTQPYNTVRDFFPHLLPKVGIVQADRNEPHKQHIIATIQTAGGKSGKRVEKILQYGPIDYLFVDECHHVAADQHINFIKRLRQENPNLKILGISATPTRSDKKLLTDIFQTEAFYISIKELVDLGWLVEPIFHRIRTKVDASKLKLSGSGESRDFTRGSMVNAVELDPGDCFKFVIDEHLEHCKDEPTIAFTPSVKGAETLAAMFRAVGVRAIHVSGKSTDAELTDAYEGMWSGKYTCIVNCDKLIEGFDMKILRHCHLVRPINADSRYIQMVGRVLRIFKEGGKTHADIYDYHAASERDFDQRMQLFKLPRMKRDTPAKRGKPKPKDYPTPTGEVEHTIMDYFGRKKEAWQTDASGWRCIKLGKGIDADSQRPLERGLALSPDGTELWAIWRFLGVPQLGIIADRWAKGRLKNRGSVSENLALIDQYTQWYGNRIIMDRTAAWRRNPPSPGYLRWGQKENVYREGMNQGELADAINRKIIMGAVERGIEWATEQEKKQMEIAL